MPDHSKGETGPGISRLLFFGSTLKLPAAKIIHFFVFFPRYNHTHITEGLSALNSDNKKHQGEVMKFIQNKSITILVLALAAFFAQISYAKDGVVEVQGAIKTLPSSGFVGNWVIGTRTVKVDSSTVIKQEIGPARVDAIVEAKATPQSDGSLLATRIEVRQTSGGGGFLEIHGIINTLPAAANRVGEWTVSNRKITVTAATVFEQTRDAFTVGVRVEIEGFLQNDGTTSASKIKTRPEDTVEDFKFLGTIGKLPADLIGDWMVSGRTVHVTAITQLEQERTRFALGVYVSVEVIPESDGSVTAKEIKTILITSTSAASFVAGTAAPDTIIAGFGSMMATDTQIAQTTPLPTTLAGTNVRVRDSLGNEREAHLFFVSPGQVNFLIPAGSAPGTATVSIRSERGDLITGILVIATIAPGLFTANANGSGPPAAVALRIKPNGEQVYERVAVYDDNLKRYVPRQISLDSDDVFLVLYGTGIRYRNNLSSVIGRAGGSDQQVTYAGGQGSLTGLDQINMRLNRNLAGRGEIEVEIEVEGHRSNAVKVNLR